MTTQHVHEAGEQAFCNKCGFFGSPSPHGTHLRPKDGVICNYSATVRTPPTPAPDSEAVAEVISYRAVNLSAVVRVIPMLNGNIPLDVGTRLYAHPPTPAQPAGGWQQEQVEAVKQAEGWLRACSDWLLTNDLDMQMPSGILDTDPLDIADALAALTQPSGEQP